MLINPSYYPWPASCYWALDVRGQYARIWVYLFEHVAQESGMGGLVWAESFSIISPRQFLLLHLDVRMRSLQMESDKKCLELLLDLRKKEKGKGGCNFMVS